MIAIGGAAGALASLATMPADVLKTRIMTAAAGSAVPNAGVLLFCLACTADFCMLSSAAAPPVWRHSLHLGEVQAGRWPTPFRDT